jgi:hypothetical protein
MDAQKWALELPIRTDGMTEKEWKKEFAKFCAQVRLFNLVAKG